MDLADTTSAAIHDMADHLYNSGALLSNGKERACEERGSAEWLETYDGPILFHFETRSVSECLEKASNQAKGIAAPIDRDKNPDKQSHRKRWTDSMCHVNLWPQFPRVFNVHQFSDAVDAEVARRLANLPLAS